jgi:tetratricopeptide (TPR) repeat protein
MRLFCLPLIYLAIAFAAPAAAETRVALVIGQNSYTGLTSLENPRIDAQRMAVLLASHGFEVLSCDGKQPGCFNLTRDELRAALGRLEDHAKGASLALVFFAGHGAATEQGNILAPVDAKVDCATGAVTQGVLVEHIMQAAGPARNKVVILDACRDNPLGEVCPGLKGKKLSFTRIEAGAMQGLLLVTSTQFGQQALDGLPGAHSPFATALFEGLEANPGIYFEQVMNEVAKGTYEIAQQQMGFLQIPGKVVGGAAPADCLAGKGCLGDARMAALAAENERLTADAAGMRNILGEEEQARGKPYTLEERQKRLAELGETLASIGKSTDPLRKEARRLINGGNVAGGQAKLDEALDADEKGLAEAERVAEERRKAAVSSARDLAVLASGKDVLKALGYYRRATRLDPENAGIWYAYGQTALVGSRTGEAKGGFAQAARAAGAKGNALYEYQAALALGGLAAFNPTDGEAVRYFQQARAIAEREAKAAPDDTAWQLNLSKSYARIGGIMLGREGDPAQALNLLRDSLTVLERLAKAKPGDAGVQRYLAESYREFGDMLRGQGQGNEPEALKAYRDSFAILESLVKTNPYSAREQYDLARLYDQQADLFWSQGNVPEALKAVRKSLVIFERLTTINPSNLDLQNKMASLYRFIGYMLKKQGDLPGALDSTKNGLVIFERLAKTDPGNSVWQSQLAMSADAIGAVLEAQGDLPGAVKSYRGCLAIYERLAGADPGSATWQSSLATSYLTLGKLYVKMGDKAEALRLFQRGRAIAAPLRDRFGKRLWIGSVKNFDKEIAALSR